jgi:hypothetical protein
LEKIKVYDELFMHYAYYKHDENMYLIFNVLGHLIGIIFKKTNIFHRNNSLIITTIGMFVKYKTKVVPLMRVPRLNSLIGRIKGSTYDPNKLEKIVSTYQIVNIEGEYCRVPTSV